MSSIPSRPLSHPVPPTPSNSSLLSQRYKDGRAICAKLGQGPPPDWKRRPQWEMAKIHTNFFTTIERVYLFAEWAVAHGDLANYLTFAETALFQIHGHHLGEENIQFPAWTKASGLTVWEKNVQEHHRFVSALDATWLYIRKCRNKLSPAPRVLDLPPPSIRLSDEELEAKYGLHVNLPFDPNALRNHMDSWLPVFQEHMTEEMDTLKPEYMQKVGPVVLNETSTKIQSALKSMAPTIFLCSVMATLDPRVVTSAFPLPWIARYILVPFVWSPKFWGAWRYLPHPELSQNLTFTGKA